MKVTLFNDQADFVNSKKLLFIILALIVSGGLLYSYVYYSFQSGVRWSDLRSDIQSNYFQDAGEDIKIKLSPLRSSLKFSGNGYAEIKGSILIDSGAGYKKYSIVAIRIDDVWVIQHLKKKSEN